MQDGQGPIAPGLVSVGSSEVAAFVRDVLLAPSRSRPAVVITSGLRSEVFGVEPSLLARRLDGRASVFTLITGEATRILASRLPASLAVYGGACRIYWPGFTIAARSADHPLFLSTGRSALSSIIDSIVAAVVMSERGAGRAVPGRQGRGESAPVRPAWKPTPDASRTPARPVLEATVIAIDGGEVRVQAGGQEGPIAYCDEKRRVLAARLQVGQTIPVFATRPLADGRPRFSTQGLLRFGFDAHAAAGRFATEPRALLSASLINQVAESPAHVASGCRVTRLPGRVTPPGKADRGSGRVDREARVVGPPRRQPMPYTLHYLCRASQRALRPDVETLVLQWGRETRTRGCELVTLRRCDLPAELRGTSLAERAQGWVLVMGDEGALITCYRATDAWRWIRRRSRRYGRRRGPQAKRWARLGGRKHRRNVYR
jgi:hypothetical protein